MSSRIETFPRWAFSLVLVISCGVALAQSDAEITGTVMDPAGAPVAATVITLTNEESGFTRSVTTDEEGRYRFVAITPGRYSVKFEAGGFKPENVTGMQLNIGSHVIRNATLTVGSVQEAINVVAEVPAIDTTRGDVSGVVTQQQIDMLPVNTRQYLNLALLMPGTTQDASRTFYNNVQIGGGGRFYANGFMIDGVSNTWAEQGEPRQNFPQGAVEEFKVNTNQFKAEMGLAMGGFVSVVTKSGTNQFHGDAFEYFRHKVLNRENRFQKAAEEQQGRGEAPFVRNQFGFDVGGPIVRNRLQFHVGYERTQTDSSYTIYTGSAGQYYGAQEGVFDQPSHDQMLNTRLDYQISQRQHLFGRWSQEWNLLTYQGCGNASSSNCYDGRFPRHALVAGHTWTPTSTLVNEFRFQYAYASFQLGPPGQPTWTELGNFSDERMNRFQTVYNFPSFSYGSGYGELGVEKRYQFKNDTTWIKGAHAIKFGVDVSRIPFADDGVSNYRGTWTFATDQLFNASDPSTIAALRSPTQFTASIPPQHTDVPVTHLSFYIQDDWRIHPRVTLSYGLRWDREYGAYNENLDTSSFPRTIPFLGDPSERGQNNNFGPRFGFAWDVTGSSRNVVRGGFGLYYNNIQTLLNFSENRNLAQCSVLIRNPSYPDPYGGQSPTSFCSTAAPNVTVIGKDFAMPYSMQFTLGYSREIARDFSLHIDGVYAHTLKDWRSVDMNYPVNGVRPLTEWGRILVRQPISQYKYRGLYMRAEKRFAQRYQFLVSYTLASNRDNNPQSSITNMTNFEQDWGPANIDRRHALVTSGSVLLPWNITLGVIWSLRSSLPFSVQSAVLDANGSRQYVPGTTRNQGARDLSLDTVNAYRATLNLTPVAASQIDSSRFNSVDIRGSKALFTWRERKLELIGQVFNLFGTENLTGGNTTRADSGNFGKILNASNLQQAELALRFVF